LACFKKDIAWILQQVCKISKDFNLYFNNPKKFYSWKMLTELDKLIKVLDLHKIFEKNATNLKWTMIEEVFERRKNDYRLKGRILALRIFGLVLFSNLTRIISLEAVAAFVAYENTSINLIEAILAETILTLSRCRRVGNGSMKCYE